MMPLFWKGSSFFLGNYRLDSLTSIGFITIKLLIVAWFVAFLEGNGLLSPGQFGSRVGQVYRNIRCCRLRERLLSL